MTINRSTTHRIVLRGPKRYDLMRGDDSLGEFDEIKLAAAAAGKDGVTDDQRIPIVDTYLNWPEQVERLTPEAVNLTDTDLLMKAMFAFKDASTDSGLTMICQRYRDQHHWDASCQWAEKHQLGLAWFTLLMDRIKAAEDGKAMPSNVTNTDDKDS